MLYSAPPLFENFRRPRYLTIFFKRSRHCPNPLETRDYAPLNVCLCPLANKSALLELLFGLFLCIMYGKQHYTIIYLL